MRGRAEDGDGAETAVGGGGMYGGFFRPGGSSSHIRCPGGTTIPISTAGSTGPLSATVSAIAASAFFALSSLPSSSSSSDSFDSSRPTILSNLYAHSIQHRRRKERSEWD